MTSRGIRSAPMGLIEDLHQIRFRVSAGRRCRAYSKRAIQPVFSPRRVHRTDAAFCYRRRTFRSLCDCMFVGHTGEQREYKSG